MLRVRLLGRLEIATGGEALTPPHAVPARELLALLALEPGAHPRGVLAARLRPDVTDACARASLRTALWTLRRDLGPEAGALSATAGHLELHAAVDVRDLLGRLDAGDPDAARLLAGAGELLADVDAEWALAARDALRERLAGALAALAAAEADPWRALGWARLRAAVDPLSEEVGRDLVRRLADAGDRGAALRAYERLAGRLARELRVAPSPATRQLAASLRSDLAATGAPPG